MAKGKSKVFKGKKMPGKMGFKWRTSRGLKVCSSNTFGYLQTLTFILEYFIPLFVSLEDYEFI